MIIVYHNVYLWAAAASLFALQKVVVVAEVGVWFVDEEMVEGDVGGR